MIERLEDLNIKKAGELDIDEWRSCLINEQMSEDFIEKYIDYLDMLYICIFQKLSEQFLERNIDGLDWWGISKNQILTDDFMRRHFSMLYTDIICVNQKLNEKFMHDYRNELDWTLLCMKQKMSEQFLEDHFDYISWSAVSRHQKLSTAFMEEHVTKLDYCDISIYQHLDDTFMSKYFKILNKEHICKYQKLSEDFIERYYESLNDMCKKNILYYQELSDDFRINHSLSIPFDNWMYIDTDYKKKAIIQTGVYECLEDYFIAYKGIRSDRYSCYNFQYQYLVGNEYECHADYTSDDNTFGFSVWTKEQAQRYCEEKVIRVKVYYEDIARVTQNAGKIRCRKITILS